MRILHCCLANFYIDHYGYQENILPRMHKHQGHDVAILASTETYVDNRVLGYVEPRHYENEDGIPVTRLAYGRGFPLKVAAKLRIYPKLYTSIESFAPDVLFLHDCQFLSMAQVAKYARAHPEVRIYVDGHTDFGNSAKGWLSRTVLHGILYRYCCKLIVPYARKFYGVLPVRVEFFKNVYGTPPDKTELLVLGAEDTRIPWDRADEVRADLRHELGLTADDFVLLCGGKIDARKNIATLMRAVHAVERPEVKLVLFGTPSDDTAAVIEELARHERIRFVGWIEADRIYDFLLASDLAIFPGTHSVLWGQAVGTGLPCVFRRWHGMQHVDVGGNCRFLETDDQAELEEVIRQIASDPILYADMKRSAMQKGIPEFSYSEIAKRAIEA